MVHIPFVPARRAIALTEAAKDFAERATVVRAQPPVAFAESLGAGDQPTPAIQP